MLAVAKKRPKNSGLDGTRTLTSPMVVHFMSTGIQENFFLFTTDFTFQYLTMRNGKVSPTLHDADFFFHVISVTKIKTLCITIYQLNGLMPIPTEKTVKFEQILTQEMAKIRSSLL